MILGLDPSAFSEGVWIALFMLGGTAAILSLIVALVDYLPPAGLYMPAIPIPPPSPSVDFREEMSLRTWEWVEADGKVGVAGRFVRASERERPAVAAYVRQHLEYNIEHDMWVLRESGSQSG